MSIFEYDAQKHIETVRSEAKAEGREEGKSYTIANVIKRMYEEKMPFDVIVDITQTSPEEVKKIIESFEI